jgi:hypothetical protein
MLNAQLMFITGEACCHPATQRTCCIQVLKIHQLFTEFQYIMSEYAVHDGVNTGFRALHNAFN